MVNIRRCMEPKRDRITTGFTDLDNLNPREKHLIILDDLMDETDQMVASLFTKKCHHKNISVMYIVQNLFHRGKHHKSQCPLHGSIQKPDKRITDHGAIPGERNFSWKPLPELRPDLTATW